MNVRWRSWVGLGTVLLCIAAGEPAAEPAARLPEGPERVAISNYIREHMKPIMDCYDQRLASSPTLKGKLIIRFDIESRGEVARATADGMTDRALIDCVMAEVRVWRFEKPPPQVILRVAYPFVFVPG